MKIRKFLDENQSVVLIVAVVVIAASAWLLYRQRPSANTFRPQVVNQWFYDLNTGEIFIGRSNQIPPFKVRTGTKPGVGVRVFSCGQCDDPSTHFIGWLEKYPEDGASPGVTPEHGDGTSMSARPAMPQMADKDQVYWVDASSETGRKLRQAVDSRCPEGFADECYTPQDVPYVEPLESQ